jgi:hypothetical protein
MAATRAKRSGGNAAAGGAKKAKIQQDENEEEFAAPDEVPDSAHSNHQVSEATTENPNVPPVEEAEDEPPLELIPQLIMRNLSKDDANEVADALRQLADLCSETTKSREQIFEYGGHSVIVTTLRRFPDTLDVQYQGCRAIANALFHLPERFSGRFGAIGAIENVLKAMNAFPQSVLLQRTATRAILYMIRSCKENTERFVNANGIESVVAAMKNFPAVKYIQRDGCDILRYCAELPNDWDRLIDLDALIVVNKVLKDHRDDEDAKESALKALAALAKADY